MLGSPSSFMDILKQNHEDDSHRRFLGKLACHPNRDNLPMGLAQCAHRLLVDTHPNIAQQDGAIRRRKMRVLVSPLHRTQSTMPVSPLLRQATTAPSTAPQTWELAARRRDTESARGWFSHGSRRIRADRQLCLRLLLLPLGGRARQSKGRRRMWAPPQRQRRLAHRKCPSPARTRKTRDDHRCLLLLSCFRNVPSAACRRFARFLVLAFTLRIATLCLCVSCACGRAKWGSNEEARHVGCIC
jgi:hypothetical protein